MDSATTLHVALGDGYKCHCLIFDYGQRHKKEITHAVKIAKNAGCEYKLVKLPFSWRGSSLLDKRSRLPERGIKHIGKDIPPTYVPSRNTVFLSVAASMAEAIGAEAVFIGANAVDYSGYPDCRPGHFKTFEKLLKQGTKKGMTGGGIRILAPLINMTKSEIVKMGTRMGVPHHLTWSCYAGGNKPCLKCDACLLRQKGFREAGIIDPLLG